MRHPVLVEIDVRPAIAEAYMPSLPSFDILEVILIHIRRFPQKDVSRTTLRRLRLSCHELRDSVDRTVSTLTLLGRPNTGAWNLIRGNESQQHLAHYVECEAQAAAKFPNACNVVLELYDPLVFKVRDDVTGLCVLNCLPCAITCTTCYSL
jgi:hypothetical protein